MIFCESSRSSFFLVRNLFRKPVPTFWDYALFVRDLFPQTGAHFSGSRTGVLGPVFAALRRTAVCTLRAAFAITAATSFGCDSYTEWLAPLISVVWLLALA